MLRDSLLGLGRRLRGEPRHAPPVELPKQRLGTPYGGYAVATELLDAGSVVYSFGIGEDVSFDLALIERFGCQVHAFDPTPRSLSWVRSQQLPPQFSVHPYGLADYDGIASFAPPKNPAHVSFNQLAGASDTSRVELPVRMLSSVMRELGHERLDVLKLDIEGGEYGVLDALGAGSIRPGQILVEFHHQLRGISVSKTERSLELLAGLGYRIFDRQPGGHEFSLLRA